MREDYSDVLNTLKGESRLREIPKSMAPEMTDFTGNDYLGIADNGETELAFMQKLQNENSHPALTSSASRLLAGRQEEYKMLEDYLGKAYGASALLFNSGYHANIGCVSAIAGSRSLVVADKLVHASIIDGLRLSAQPFKRFPHNDVCRLRKLLETESRNNHKCIWIVVESIYSMDGDEAPLRELVALKKEFPQIRLYVDEAHGLGVRGDSGLGVCEELGILRDVDILIGTFGKACASMGAFAICSGSLRMYLLNTARSFIFSTALPPLNVSYTLHVLHAIRTMSAEREKLRQLSRHLRTGLEMLTGMTSTSTSQIVPWITGSSNRAVDYAARLRKSGFMVMPIRRPTVAAGTERIRFSLSASLEHEDIDRLLKAIEDIVKHED